MAANAENATHSSTDPWASADNWAGNTHTPSRPFGISSPGSPVTAEAPKIFFVAPDGPEDLPTSELPSWDPKTASNAKRGNVLAIGLIAVGSFLILLVFALALRANLFTTNATLASGTTKAHPTTGVRGGATPASGTTPVTPTTDAAAPTAAPVDQGGAGESVDDGVIGTGPNQFTYQGNWKHCTNCGNDLFKGSNSWSSSTDDTATVTFTGTQIAVYGVKDRHHGIAAITIDGGQAIQVDLYAATRAGNTLLWTSAALPSGQHTLVIRITGEKSAASSNTVIALDRVVIRR